MPRYYTCPGCGGPMVKAAPWACWGDPPCGSTGPPVEAETVRRSEAQKSPRAVAAHSARRGSRQAGRSGGTCRRCGQKFATASGRAWHDLNRPDCAIRPSNRSSHSASSGPSALPAAAAMSSTDSDATDWLEEKRAREQASFAAAQASAAARAREQAAALALRRQAPVSAPVWRQVWGLVKVALVVALVLAAIFAFAYCSRDKSGSGQPVICRDGWVSYSGGIQGACSHHGGVAP